MNAEKEYTGNQESGNIRNTRVHKEPVGKKKIKKKTKARDPLKNVSLQKFRTIRKQESILNFNEWKEKNWKKYVSEVGKPRNTSKVHEHFL